MAVRKTNVDRRAGARSAAAGRSRAAWRQILSGSRPRDVLGRLMNGDPLELRRVVAEALREHGYLLDADRVYLRALARCARFSVRYRGRPELEAWSRERVDEALQDLLREDLEAERRGLDLTAAELGAFEDLARPLGLDPARARSVCVAFNHCPEPERAAFFALVIEGRSIDDLARGESSATEVARRARRALEATLNAEPKS